jgi:lysophospholipid acyltransferase (LPLAT)-like uncharacterized protein
MGRVTGPERKWSRKDELRLRAIVGAARVVSFFLGGTYRVLQSGRTIAQRRREGEDAHGVYAIWHRDIWLLARHLRREEMVVLASDSKDGELAARFLESLGYESLRGSSSRGATKALLGMARAARERRLDPIFSIDGPRGPALVAKPGVTFAASRAALPVVPLGIAVDRTWSLGSWDGHRIAKPFARIALAIGADVHVPDDASQDELAWRWTGVVQEAMLRAGEEAQRMLAERR